MRFAGGLIIAGLVAWGGAAHAGAWTQPKGKGQVIVKAEAMRATDAYVEGGTAPLFAPREDRSIGVFAEYGVTDAVTIQLKGDWQSGQDAFYEYDGRGPVELGATVRVWRDDRNAVSLYGGYAQAGDARNAAYEAPGQGDHDWEVRASYGRSTGPLPGLFGVRGDNAFVEVQVARRWRSGLPDETRADLTTGVRFARHWMLLGQAFGGAQEGERARWLSAETSLVRDLGPWSLQAGWRQTTAGRDVPIASGPVIALWRRF